MPDLHDAIPLPPTTLLAHSPAASGTDAEGEAGVRTLTALFEVFRIQARITGYARGPAAVTFNVESGADGRLTQIISFAQNIEYALPGAQVLTDPVRQSVSIRVPSTRRSPVLLGDLLLDTRAAGNKYPLSAILGVDSTGTPVTVNVTDLPHLLMAGTTGSGKSTCLHAILLSVLMHATPHEVRMILIDTRSLELSRYHGIQHLISPVATKPEKAAEVLAWAAREAQVRLDDLSAVGMRRIEDFNAAVRSGSIAAPLGESRALSPHPLLLIAIDDLADLLRSSQRTEIEESLLQIGTRGRIAGVHVVAGTRHPQARALPTRVSATMPARLSFAATEGAVPTRTLRIGTAELRFPGTPPIGVWCANVSEREIDAVAAFWRA